eukprot:7177492-Pyramimonas_sp.AAC.1
MATTRSPSSNTASPSAAAAVTSAAASSGCRSRARPTCPANSPSTPCAPRALYFATTPSVPCEPGG